MFITFGKHHGKSVEQLVLKHPDYVVWMLGREVATGEFCEVQQAARQLIPVFNDKPILVPCQGHDCGNPATRGTVSRGAVWPRWWCDDCDPYDFGASPGKLYIVRSFGEASSYVHTFCGGSKQALRILIKELARAKGLPTRVGEEQAKAFFGHSKG